MDRATKGAFCKRLCEQELSCLGGVVATGPTSQCFVQCASNALCSNDGAIIDKLDACIAGECSGYSTCVQGVPACEALPSGAAGSSGQGDGGVAPGKVVVTPRGQAMGPAFQQAVPITGGKVMSPDGRLAIEIPPGALAYAQTITVQPITSHSPGGVGRAYRLGPEGQTFASPVRVTFNYTGGDVQGSDAGGLGIAYQDSQGRWNVLKSVTRDTAAKTVSVVTTHFSDWSLLQGFQLRPGRRSLAPGGVVNLEVVLCAPSAEESEDELSLLGVPCAPDDSFSVSEWAANGRPLGDPEVGLLTPSTDTTARYEAPNRAPQSNPVAVSAQVFDTSGRKLLLVAIIWIDAHSQLRGTITSRHEFPGILPGDSDVLTISAQVTFVWDPPLGKLGYLYRVKSGMISAHRRISRGENCVVDMSHTGALEPGIDGSGLDLGFLPENTLNPNPTLQDSPYPFYRWEGNTTALFTGTTTCGEGGLKPAEEDLGLPWWPFDDSRGYFAKADGRLEDAMKKIFPDSGFIEAQWSLIPDK